MTIIHDLDAPAVEPQMRAANQTSGCTRLLVILGISALALTAVNLAASVRLYRVNSDITALESRLEQLSSFEKRLVDKIDLVNTGLQNQFDQLNSSFDTRFASVSSSVGELKHSLAQVTGELENNSFASSPSLTEPATFTGDQAPQQAAEADTSVMIAKPRKKGVIELPSLSPSYQRFQTADGKVTYRKIR
jgi:hypothetical protein